MDLSVLSTTTILLFLLMLIRMTGMLISAPFFSQMGVPVQLQVGMSLAFTFVLFPLYSANAHLPATDLWTFTWVAAQEFIIGLLIGFLAGLVFAAVQLAGSHVTQQMGLGIANAVDPVSQEQSTVVGQLYFIVAILLFLSLNIHHNLIIAVAKSFDVIPLASAALNPAMLAARFTEMGGNVFTLSVMLVMPIIGIMLVQEVAMAFVSKIMPQMNIFMVALPLKIGVGLLLIYATLPFTSSALGNTFQELTKVMMIIYK